jgi:hypothetical protein
MSEHKPLKKRMINSKRYCWNRITHILLLFHVRFDTLIVN